MVNIFAPPINQESDNPDFSQKGVVKSIDLANGEAIVTLDDIDTPPIPWLDRAGIIKTWLPPSIGEQVEVIAPNGDFEGAFIVGGVFSNANPAPSSNANPKITYGSCSIEIQPTKMIMVGDIELTGKLTASDDVIADGKSLKTHKHGQVQAGAAQTGTPV